MKLVRLTIGILAVSILAITTATQAAAADPSSALSEAGSALLSGQSVSFGGDVTVPNGETRDGDVVAFGGNVRVDGTVTQDVVAMGGAVVINGTVQRNVAAFGGDVTLGPAAKVGGDVSVVGGHLNRARTAVVSGNITTGHNIDGAFTGFHDPVFNGFGWGGFAFGVVIAIGITLLGLLILLFFPRQLLATGTTVEQRPLESFGLGCGGVIAGIALMILFAITIIFIPISLALATAITLAWLFGWAAIFVVIGQRLLRSANRAQELVPAVLLGGVLIGILANIPVVNVFVLLIGGSVALGAVIYSRFGTRPPSLPLIGGGTQPVNPPPTPA